MMQIGELSDRNFTAEVRLDRGTKLVEFWGPNCSHCRNLAPILQRVAAAFEGRAKIYKLNVSKHPVTAAKYGVRALPTLLFFLDGELVETLVGAQKEANITQTLEKYILSEA